MNTLTLKKLDAYNDLRQSINKAIEAIGPNATANYLQDLLNKTDHDNYWTISGVDMKQEAERYMDRYGISYGNEVVGRE